MNKTPCIPEELANMEQERRGLMNIERPAVIQAIASARELGDLSENAEYHAAREKQGFIEGRIQSLNTMIAQSNVLDPKEIQSDNVKFGATVTISDLDTNENKIYKIIGTYLANPSVGLLSYTSPLAKAMIGKKVEDIVEIDSAKGRKEYEIVNIEYK